MLSKYWWTSRPVWSESYYYFQDNAYIGNLIYSKNVNNNKEGNETTSRKFYKGYNLVTKEYWNAKFKEYLSAS